MSFWWLETSENQVKLWLTYSKTEVWGLTSTNWQDSFSGS
jgi:hypothetical protein